ncbi:MAG: carbohydrate binding family 9 domain-containing protein, partial [Gemmatimonadota bacterium]|nr:carbohydrate binding family 9 domain-containing protein [Gemmatimonadota bacterium]
MTRLLVLVSLLGWAAPLRTLPGQGTGGTGANAARRPALAVGPLHDGLRLDGRLDEPMWAAARPIGPLTMTEPVEGGVPTCTTTVWVLAGPASLVIGIRAADPDPRRITSFAIARDADLRNEDHVRIVLDPFLDGRSGYVFAVNPRGARFDALISGGGAGEDDRWDGIWEAATHRDASGWSVEIRLPVQSIDFTPGLTAWGFNVERRVERLQEVSRWASPTRDIKVTQMSRAGVLTELPAFSPGLGLTIRPATTAGVAYEGAAVDDTRGTFHPSVDVLQRLGSLTALASINTDFAETEVDTRRTNLTRFPLFFEEKRTFFLEGSDIFDFGLGLRSFRSPDLVPFFSRRIGLFQGTEVPVWVGGKLNGRVGATNVGALLTRTGRVDTLGIEPTTMGAMRLRQNVFTESSGGIIATVGDPEGRSGSYLVGGDFTFQTSRLGGDKNFQIGGWALVTGREGLTGDRTAVGGAITYPNDTWDVAVRYRRIGDEFDPSLGFVPRRGVQLLNADVDVTVRPGWRWLRSMAHEFRPSLALD